MGQGHYQAVGYGVLLNTKPLKQAIERMSEEDWDLVDKHDIKTSYESKIPYWCVLVWDGRDDLAPATTRLVDFVAERKVTPAMAKRWEKFAEAVKQRLGVILPAPEVLWIADYD